MDFDTIIERRNTGSSKWNKYGDRDIIPMWVADMDFQSPPAVLDAIRTRVDHAVFGYTDPTSELIETIVTMLDRKYHWQIQPDWLVWMPGLVSALNVTCRATGDESSAVLTTVPVYHPFMSAPENMQRRLLTVPLVNDNNYWSMDFDALESAITPDTRLFILCNPHNPTGRVYSREELARLAEICAKHDLIICSDEIHCELILDQDKTHLPIATLDADIADRTITLMAPSKTFNLAGLGCSFAVIPNAELRQRFQRAKAGIVPRVNTLGYAAALGAYRDGEPWRKALLDYLRSNRAYLAEAMAELPGLSMNSVEATYLAWIDARDTRLQDSAGFFEEAGVGLHNGAIFKGPGFLRLNFGCPRALLEQALDRMRQALQT